MAYEISDRVMQRNILITGPDHVLGTNLAAVCLKSSSDSVFYLLQEGGEPSSQELRDSVCQIVQQIPGEQTPGAGEEIKSRFCVRTVSGDNQVLPSDEVFPEAPHFEEVWYFAGKSSATDSVHELIATLPGLGGPQFNYAESAAVTAAKVANQSNNSRTEQEIIRYGEKHGISCRIFRTPLIVTAIQPLPHARQHDFLQFVAALHELKTEIEKRLPDYFDFQSLRCLAIEEPLNLVRAYDATRLMLAIARHDETAGKQYYIACPASIPFNDLCERIGMVYGVGLLPVNDRKELNAIDEVFQARIKDLYAHMESLETPQAKANELYRFAGIAPEDAVIAEEEQVSLLEAIRARQDAMEAKTAQRVANLPTALAKKTIERKGFEFTYCMAGSSGTPVVILNALGQGLNLWYPLVDKLMRNHRVIVWEPRGILCPPIPFQLSDQVDDLDAILQHENIEQCHLVCWCTGPKVAVEFYLRRPAAARSMVFLNSTFSYPPGPKTIQELDSDYGRNHAALCRALDASPTMAGSVMRALQSISSGGEVNPLEADNKQLATSVLSLISLDLKPHILAPFQNESATLNYARQVLDFLSYDALSKAGQVTAPVLFLGGEYDVVASPFMARAAARFFPNVRYLQVQGATHYCVYDRPGLIAQVMDRFFRDPGQTYWPSGEVVELAAIG